MLHFRLTITADQRKARDRKLAAAKRHGARRRTNFIRTIAAGAHYQQTAQAAGGRTTGGRASRGLRPPTPLLWCQRWAVQAGTGSPAETDEAAAAGTGAPALQHTSAQTKRFFAAPAARLPVQQLPGYAPDDNPLARRWQNSKQAEPHRHYFPPFAARSTKVAQALSRFANTPQAIRTLCSLPEEMA